MLGIKRHLLAIHRNLERLRRMELVLPAAGVIRPQLIVLRVPFGQVDDHPPHSPHRHVRIPRRQRLGDDDDNLVIPQHIVAVNAVHLFPLGSKLLPGLFRE